MTDSTTRIPRHALAAASLFAGFALSLPAAAGNLYSLVNIGMPAGADSAIGVRMNNLGPFVGSAQSATGDTVFSTLGATTDGPMLPASCSEPAGRFLGMDIWYAFEPTGDGVLTVSTCQQADFNTRLAAYTGTCGALQIAGCTATPPVASTPTRRSWKCP